MHSLWIGLWLPVFRIILVYQNLVVDLQLYRLLNLVCFFQNIYIGVFWITLYPFDTVLPGTQKSRGLEYLTYSKRIYNLKADIQGFPTVPGSRTGDKIGPLNFVSAQQCSGILKT